MSTDIRATYRVQVHEQFNLDNAAHIVDYLSKLGITHLYTSPILQAAPGSTHGYDVVNHHEVSRDLGGASAHQRLFAALQQQGMGHVLDIVPNHMAIIAPGNPWWWDVLMHGQASKYASYFDVEWHPPEARNQNRVLVPVLGDHYGRVLEAGELQLAYNDGEFVIKYYDNVYPVDPASLRDVLLHAAKQANSDDLAFIADAFARLPSAQFTGRLNAEQRYRDQAVLCDMLQRLAAGDTEIAAAIEKAVTETNGNPELLNALLEQQNYRLAFWRVTEEELTYRRFFDIDSLIGLCMEDERVFRDTHKLILGWLENGMVHGLRIDHPDGMRDPEGYLRRLQAAQRGIWVVVEKILELNERLPASWPVAGTSGYDFLNRVNGLFIDPSGVKPFTDLYVTFTGERSDFKSLVYETKHYVMSELLGSDVERLTELFLRVCERHRRYRDYTRSDVRAVLREVAACFPVYRTYVRAEENQVDQCDVQFVNEAVEAAKEHSPHLDPDLFDFFRDVLLLRVTGDVESELLMRFQQFTSPVMAKGVEDTAFYRFNRFVSLNEVGGDPGQFGTSPDAFHRACADTLARWPTTMLSTSTHDTKRSEDVRARLNVLSEIPERWGEAVQRWASMNEKLRRDNLPDRNAEYLLYQTLVGAWPIDEERTLRYMEKAIREAKAYTSWTDPNEAYEEALFTFVKGILSDEAFIRDLEAFVSQLVEPGRINSLSQTLLKLTAPGVPDLYQGTELWNLSLVDPDNRQPVDYEQRRLLLEVLDQELSPEEIWARVDEGLPKLWVIRQALKLRHEHRDCFGSHGSYRPLEISQTERAIAFVRGDEVVTVVPRLIGRERGWGNGTVALPPGAWYNVLTNEQVDGSEQNLAKLFARFPAALLSRAATAKRGA